MTELNSNKKRLEEVWVEGLEEGAKYFYLEFKLPDHPATEVIVNPIENVPNKLAYIEKQYGGDLRSKHNSEVEIVSFGYVHNMSQLEYARNNSEVLDND